MAELDDPELARRIERAAPAVARDDEAELCRRYARRVFFFGLRHLRGEDQAYDLVQDVLLVTFEKLRAGDDRSPGRVGSFVLGTARLVSRSIRRVGDREKAIDTTSDSPYWA